MRIIIGAIIYGYLLLVRCIIIPHPDTTDHACVGDRGVRRDRAAQERRAGQRQQVREPPRWPRSWANFSLFWLYSHPNAWANLYLLGQPNAFLATVMSKLAQKLGQLQPFMPVFPLEFMGQLASLGQPEAFRTHCVPKVRELLREFFGGKEPHMSIAPDEVAAHGAAVQAEAQVRKAPSWPRSRANFSRL